jgi:hypothetical protein
MTRGNLGKALTLRDPNVRLLAPLGPYDVPLDSFSLVDKVYEDTMLQRALDCISFNCKSNNSGKLLRVNKTKNFGARSNFT